MIAITPPSVSSQLFDVYGPEFKYASQDDRLLLLEAIAFSLRVGGAWCENLCAISYGSRLPKSVFTRAEVGKNEGLRLLVILQVAIVESYSVSAANERLAN